jgi:CubicO group peptidase (beta-lactamase class C family)
VSQLAAGTSTGYTADSGSLVTDARFDAVASLFEGYLRDDENFSAQLSVWCGGRLVVELAGGRLGADDLTGVFSVTKGVSAIVIASLLDAGLLDLSQTVAHYWPEFGVEGKEAVTIRELLSHQAGLPVVEGRIPFDDIMIDSAPAAAQLAAQAPLWRPGSAFGYHALTIGTLMEELVRRVTGATLQQIFEADIRSSRGHEVYLGLPADLEHRYVAIGDMVPNPDERAEIDARPPADSLSALVFDNIEASTTLSAEGFSTNNPRARRAGQAAIGAVASARGLAGLYADTLATARTPIASPPSFRAMAQQHSWGTDRVLNCPNSFGAVFMLPQPRMPFGGIHAYGHDGAGGALAFADPETQIAFGYIPHPMQYPGGADHRAVTLARAVRECVLGATVSTAVEAIR